MNSALSGINKETVAFITGGCFLIGISTQFDDPYRTISFATGMIIIPLSFVWNYVENRMKTKERQELQRILQEQLERTKVKCPKCGQRIIPKKVGEIFLCSECGHQFKSTQQKIEEIEKGIETADKIIDLLNSI